MVTRKRVVSMVPCAVVVCCLGAISTATSALAELRICNMTPARVGVAIGYQDAQGWATEGWWNVSARTCETLLKDQIPSRYVFLHAIDYERGGEWSGSNMMCTGEKAFLIRGVDECRSRGYRQSGFYEVDTGGESKWTIQLADPEATGSIGQ